MARYEGSRQIYEELVEKADLNWLLVLLAYAIVEEQRVEREKHVEARDGRAPSGDEIRRWYIDLPENQLTRARGQAESALETYASQVWDESGTPNAMTYVVAPSSRRSGARSAFGRSSGSAWRPGW